MVRKVAFLSALKKNTKIVLQDVKSEFWEKVRIARNKTQKIINFKTKCHNWKGEKSELLDLFIF